MKLLAILSMAWLAAAASVLCASRPAAGLSPNVSTLVHGANTFAFDLYAHLRNRPGNLFFSPTSLSTALGMTYAGARAGTASEMAHTLHLDIPANDVSPAFAELLQRLPTNGQGDILTIANALWPQQGYAFRPQYIQLVRQDFHAGLQELDFAQNNEGARHTINHWVENETRNKITELLSPGILSPDTRLVLTNAIYFNGKWSHPFVSEQTRPGDFWIGPNEKVSTPLMHDTHGYRYTETDQFQAVELPYRGSLSLFVLLPRQQDGLATLEQSLDADHLDQSLRHMRTSEVDLTMPRFKTTATFSLKRELSELGMPVAFSPRADFSGMSDKEGLCMSQVVHKAYVDVNEKGTEAAAASGITMMPTAAMIPPKRVVFRADHPFIFMIRDRSTGSILFLGRLTNPQT